MPIEKERLLNLLNTASHIQATYGSIIESVLASLRRRKAGEISADEALEAIEYVCAGHEYSIMQDIVVLTREQTHWRLTHRKAERNKLYQEQRRRGEGRPQIKPPSAALQSKSATSWPEFAKQMESFGYSMEDALALWSDEYKPKIPAGYNSKLYPVEPSADAASVFEPSIEDTEGWALPSADDDEEPPV